MRCISPVTTHFRRPVTRVPSIHEIADRHPLESADKRSEASLAPMQVDALAK